MLCSDSVRDAPLSSYADRGSAVIDTVPGGARGGGSAGLALSVRF